MMVQAFGLHTPAQTATAPSLQGFAIVAEGNALGPEPPRFSAL